MFYNEPIIVEPVSVDDPNNGVPSHHSGVVVIPILDAAVPPLRTKSTKVFCSMPESLINKFVEQICNLSWDFLFLELSSTELTELFQTKMSSVIDTNFPLKHITMTDSDQPWITQDLKKLKRIHRQEFCRHGRSLRYREIKKQFESKQIEAIKK